MSSPVINMDSKRSLIREFFSPKLATVTLLVLATVAESCVTIILSLSIGNYYEMISNHHSNKGRLLHLFHISLPHEPGIFFAAFAGVILLKTGLQFAEKYASETLGTSFTLWLQQKLFRHHVRMGMADFDQKPVGKYLLRYSGDMNSIRHYITGGAFHFTSDCIFLVISLSMLLAIDFKMTLVVIAALTLGFLLIVLINQKLKKIQVTHRDMLAANLNFVNEGLKSITTLKLYTREYATIKKYKKRMDKLMTVNRKYIFLRSINIALPHAILSLTLLLVFIAHLHGAAWGMDSLGPGGRVIPYILLIILLFPMYKRFLEVNPIWQAGNISFSKIIAVLNKPLEADSGGTEYLPSEGLVEFRNVSFGYSPGRMIFTNLSFCCRPGEINKLQGDYKSTILKLILGIYQPVEGSILLDGTDIGLLTKKSLRDNIALISEEAPLYGNTIAKCLFLKKDDPLCIRALDLLDQLRFDPEDRFINLEETIGEGGRYLSKSRYKKLIIVRALLEDKKIILTDDLFEHVDDETEMVIRKLLNQLKETHTVIVAGDVPFELRPLSILMAS